ncbi:uncharacterized protein LOC129881794 [Solanum dulcamara]|uniref:uncharacterized protein LOC129881794 n=1 Tax=Solanum dulcamara TaxID=45834 RepID=UPI0024862484|nr:uncharacterized protein LOC129881794 [Solanum dulcamara]
MQSSTLILFIIYLTLLLAPHYYYLFFCSAINTSVFHFLFLYIFQKLILPCFISSVFLQMAPLHSQLLVFSTLILLLNVHLTHTTSTTTIAKDQITCTMCSSCDNPCLPIFSPPPSSPPLPPPSSSNYNYPPSPSTPQSCPRGGCSQQPLSPPYIGGGDGGGGGDGDYYYSPTDPSVYPIPPPPNPIVPYFPFYFYNPPSPYTVDSKSLQFKNHPFITCLILLLPIFLFL